MKHDVLLPCPGCRCVRNADPGHHLCRECEGYPQHGGSDFMEPPLRSLYMDETRPPKRKPSILANHRFMSPLLSACLIAALGCVVKWNLTLALVAFLLGVVIVLVFLLATTTDALRQAGHLPANPPSEIQ